MKRHFLILLVICMALSGGCSSRSHASKPLCRVVTHISITREQGNTVVQRSYSDSQSMSAILSYLRRINPYGNGEAAASQTSESRYHIRLDYSDGTQHIYQQRGDNLFLGTEGKWKLIDEDLGHELPSLFELLPEEDAL